MSSSFEYENPEQLKVKELTDYIAVLERACDVYRRILIVPRRCWAVGMEESLEKMDKNLKELKCLV